jgi:glycine cleavage system aminomethyltransferase T
VAARNLQELIDGTDSLVDMLRNIQTGPNVYPVTAEFTNWRDEQWAWQNTCILFDLSYHMVDLRLEGPGALDVLKLVGFNSFDGFDVNKAKQLAPCTPEGYVIGDVILFHLDDEVYELVGRIPSINWVVYQAETGHFDVEWEIDERTVMRDDPSRRRSYRVQIQGPNAMATMEKVLGGPPPEVRFFNMTTLEIARRPVRALRHGMAGQPGFELFGPWDDKGPVVEAIVEAGEGFGIRRVGARAYSSNTLESGWIPSPLPAIYTSPELRAYRQWLPADSYEGRASLGGSFVSDDIEDYYLNPWDLGYGHFVRFDHDYIGREALREMAEDPPREKVTLALEDEDVLAVIGSQLGEPEQRGKFIEFPSAVYSMHPYDAVTRDGEDIGISTWIGYSSNEGKMLTLAVIDKEHAVPGREVTLIWGEPERGTTKPTVEPHVQMEVRAIVSPAPYSKVAREVYRKGALT